MPYLVSSRRESSGWPRRTLNSRRIEASTTDNRAGPLRCWSQYQLHATIDLRPGQGRDPELNMSNNRLLAFSPSPSRSGFSVVIQNPTATGSRSSAQTGHTTLFNLLFVPTHFWAAARFVRDLCWIYAFLQPLSCVPWAFANLLHCPTQLLIHVRTRCLVALDR